MLLVWDTNLKLQLNVLTFLCFFHIEHCGIIAIKTKQKLIVESAFLTSLCMQFLAENGKISFPCHSISSQPVKWSWASCNDQEAGWKRWGIFLASLWEKSDALRTQTYRVNTMNSQNHWRIQATYITGMDTSLTRLPACSPVGKVQYSFLMLERKHYRLSPKRWPKIFLFSAPRVQMHCAAW